jgi:hypothetical protein
VARGIIRRNSSAGRPPRLPSAVLHLNVTGDISMTCSWWSALPSFGGHSGWNPLYRDKYGGIEISAKLHIGTRIMSFGPRLYCLCGIVLPGSLVRNAFVFQASSGWDCHHDCFCSVPIDMGLGSENRLMMSRLYDEHASEMLKIALTD